MRSVYLSSSTAFGKSPIGSGMSAAIAWVGREGRRIRLRVSLEVSFEEAGRRVRRHHPRTARRVRLRVARRERHARRLVLHVVGAERDGDDGRGEELAELGA